MGLASVFRRQHLAINKLIGFYNLRITIRILAVMSLLMSVSSVTYDGLTIVQEHCVEMEKSNASKHSTSWTILRLKLRIFEFFKLNPWKKQGLYGMGRFPTLHRVWKLYTICRFGKYNYETFTVFFQRPLARAKGLGKL